MSSRIAHPQINYTKDVSEDSRGISGNNVYAKPGYTFQELCWVVVEQKAPASESSSERSTDYGRDSTLMSH